MKKPMIIMGGFGGIRESEPFITTAENKKNTQVAIDDWMLGPAKPSNERGANKPYWMKLAKAMQVDEKEARRRRCSNCEYYDNSTMMQAKMEQVRRMGSLLPGAVFALRAMTSEGLPPRLATVAPRWARYSAVCSMAPES